LFTSHNCHLCPQRNLKERVSWCNALKQAFTDSPQATIIGDFNENFNLIANTPFMNLCCQLNLERILDQSHLPATWSRGPLSSSIDYALTTQTHPLLHCLNPSAADLHIDHCALLLLAHPSHVYPPPLQTLFRYKLPEDHISRWKDATTINHGFHSFDDLQRHLSKAASHVLPSYSIAPARIAQIQKLRSLPILQAKNTAFHLIQFHRTLKQPLPQQICTELLDILSPPSSVLTQILILSPLPPYFSPSWYSRLSHAISTWSRQQIAETEQRHISTAIDTLQAQGCRNPMKLFSALKDPKTELPSILINPDTQNQISDPIQVIEIFSNYLRSLFKAHMPPTELPRLPLPFPIEIPPSTLMESVSKEQIQSIISHVSSHSSPGISGISYLLLKHCHPDVAASIAKLISMYLEGKICLSDSFRHSAIRFIPKPEQPTDNLCNYRPIALLECIYKLLTHIIYHRLEHAFTTYIGWLPIQAGFRRHFSTMIHHAHLAHLLNQSSSQNPLIGLFLDITKAYDSIPHWSIIQILFHFGFPSCFVNIIADLYQNNLVSAITPWGLTNAVPAEVGLRQGDPLSPLLFNITLEYIFRLSNSPTNNITASTFAFADDIAIVGTDHNLLQASLVKLTDALAMIDLHLSLKKCGVVHFNWPDDIPRPTFQIPTDTGAVTISDCSGYKYLGIRYNSNLCFNEHFHCISNKIISRLGMIRPKALSPHQKSYICNMAIVPIATYTAQALLIPTTLTSLWDSAIEKCILFHLANPTKVSKILLYSPSISGGLGTHQMTAACLATSLTSLARLNHHSMTIYDPLCPTKTSPHFPTWSIWSLSNDQLQSYHLTTHQIPPDLSTPPFPLGISFDTPTSTHWTVFTDASFDNSTNITTSTALMLDPKHTFLRTQGLTNSATEGEIAAIVLTLQVVPRNQPLSIVTDSLNCIRQLNYLNQHHSMSSFSYFGYLSPLEHWWQWAAILLHHRTAETIFRHIYSHQSDKIVQWKDSLQRLQSLQLSNAKYGEMLPHYIFGNQLADEMCKLPPRLTDIPLKIPVSPSRSLFFSNDGKILVPSFRTLYHHIQHQLIEFSCSQTSSTSFPIHPPVELFQLPFKHIVNKVLPITRRTGRLIMIQNSIGANKIRGIPNFTTAQHFRRLPASAQRYWLDPTCPFGCAAKDSTVHRIFECEQTLHWRISMSTELSGILQQSIAAKHLCHIWDISNFNWPPKWTISGFWPQATSLKFPISKQNYLQAWLTWTRSVGLVLKSLEKITFQLSLQSCQHHKQHKRPYSDFIAIRPTTPHSIAILSANKRIRVDPYHPPRPPD